MTKRQLAGLLAIVVLTAVALNIAGLLRYPGGPLRETSADGPLWLDIRPANQGTNAQGATSGAGLLAGELIYVGLAMSSGATQTALIEGVRLVNPTPGLQFVEALLSKPGTTGGLFGPAHANSPFLDEFNIDTDFQPLPAQLAGGDSVTSGRIVLGVRAAEPGEYAYEAVAVDYRLGPFAFTVTYHQALIMCLNPLPEGGGCSIDDGFR